MYVTTTDIDPVAVSVGFGYTARGVIGYTSPIDAGR